MTARLPLLACPACGVEDLPRVVTPGSGPHWGKAVCPCGRFLKWVARPKEVCGMPSINRMLLVGAVSKQGVELAFVGARAKASFQLVLSEAGQDGREHLTFVPIECWGRHAERVSTQLEAGDVVALEGKLGKRKRGESWELIVTAFDAHPLRLPAAVG
jgi:Single-strand binding protein family